jgi:hypothetical protein
MKSKNTKAFMRSLDPSFQFIFFKEERSELSNKLGQLRMMLLLMK